MTTQALNYEECLKSHGLHDQNLKSDSDSDGGRSELDETYFRNRLPSLEIDESKIVLIRAIPEENANSQAKINSAANPEDDRNTQKKNLLYSEKSSQEDTNKSTRKNKRAQFGNPQSTEYKLFKVPKQRENPQKLGAQLNNTPRSDAKSLDVGKPKESSRFTSKSDDDNNIGKENVHSGAKSLENTQSDTKSVDVDKPKKSLRSSSKSDDKPRNENTPEKISRELWFMQDPPLYTNSAIASGSVTTNHSHRNLRTGFGEHNRGRLTPRVQNQIAPRVQNQIAPRVQNEILEPSGLTVRVNVFDPNPFRSIHSTEDSLMDRIRSSDVTLPSENTLPQIPYQRYHNVPSTDSTSQVVAHNNHSEPSPDEASCCQKFLNCLCFIC